MGYVYVDMLKNTAWASYALLVIYSRISTASMLAHSSQLLYQQCITCGACLVYVAY